MHELQKQLYKLAQTHDLDKLGIRAITRLVGEKYPQKVKHHLQKLEDKGLIEIEKQSGKIKAKKANIKTGSDLYSIPIVGAANCGEANLFAEECLEGFLRLSSNILDKINKKMFAIKAVGNSMNRATVGKGRKNIEDGDYVIFDGRDFDLNYYNNKYVLSVIDGVANIKKFDLDKKNQQIILRSESTENYPPIFIHNKDMINYKINGIAVKVIKNST